MRRMRVIGHSRSTCPNSARCGTPWHSPVCTAGAAIRPAVPPPAAGLRAGASTETGDVFFARAEAGVRAPGGRPPGRERGGLGANSGAPPPRPPEHVLARRARLRRIVAGIVVGLG